MAQLQIETNLGPAIDRSLIDDVVREFTDRSGEHGEATILVVDDFAAAVRRYAPGSAEAAEFTQIRGTGVVGGKTLPQPDGSCIVVVSAFVFGADDQGHAIDRNLARRLLAHEAGHVAMYNRGEAGHGRLTKGPFVDRQFFGMAAIALEEFRAERSLCEEGWPPDYDVQADIEDVVAEFGPRLRQALQIQAPNESIERPMHETTTAFHELVNRMGYVAGLVVTLDPRPALGRVRHRAAWERFVGPHYEAFVASLEQCPPAATPMDRSEVDEAVIEVAEVLRRWLSHIGFEFSDEPVGTRWDVVRHDW